MTRPSKLSLAPARDPLHAFRSKRNYALTPEPAEGGPSVADPVTFVDQKHLAGSGGP